MPVYLDDEMIGPKALINASTIRRLQHHHPAKVAQHDQANNPTENDEGFYQSQVQQQPVQMQDQQTLEFQRIMEAHAVGVTRWMTEVSPTLYAESKKFTRVFRDFHNQ